MEAYEKAKCLCEEFTDCVLLDRTRHSILINIDKAFFRVVKKELEKLGYMLVFTKALHDGTTITCSFKLEPHIHG